MNKYTKPHRREALRTIDGLERPEILGTVAGDDAVLIVAGDEEKRTHVE